jgi:hypothetical protein
MLKELYSIAKSIQILLKHQKCWDRQPSAKASHVAKPHSPELSQILPRLSNGLPILESPSYPKLCKSSGVTDLLDS